WKLFRSPMCVSSLIEAFGDDFAVLGLRVVNDDVEVGDHYDCRDDESERTEGIVETGGGDGSRRFGREPELLPSCGHGFVLAETLPSLVGELQGRLAASREPQIEGCEKCEQHEGEQEKRVERLSDERLLRRLVLLLCHLALLRLRFFHDVEVV